MTISPNTILAAAAACLERVLSEDLIDDRARKRLQSLMRDVKATVGQSREVTVEDVVRAGDPDPTSLDELSIYPDQRPALSETTRDALRAAGVETIGDLELFAEEYALAGEDREAFRAARGTNLYDEAEALGLLMTYRTLRSEV